MNEQQLREVGQALEVETWASSYDVFAKKSMIPKELKDASYKTYTVTNRIEGEAKQFALKINEFYFKHQGKGNTIIQGKPGIGKSHLTISIAKKLNMDWRSISEPKSVLFISVPKMFQRIQEGFGYKDGTSAQQMIDMLVKADYLFLDDFGKESTFGRQTKEANEWKQNILLCLVPTMYLIEKENGCTIFGIIFLRFHEWLFPSLCAGRYLLLS